jgi:hypothetical protein
MEEFVKNPESWSLSLTPVDHLRCSILAVGTFRRAFTRKALGSHDKTH